MLLNANVSFLFPGNKTRTLGCKHLPIFLKYEIIISCSKMLGLKLRDPIYKMARDNTLFTIRFMDNQHYNMNIKWNFYIFIFNGKWNSLHFKWNFSLSFLMYYNIIYIYLT